jgi:hypothetical protein
MGHQLGPTRDVNLPVLSTNVVMDIRQWTVDHQDKMVAVKSRHSGSVTKVAIHPTTRYCPVLILLTPSVHLVRL